MVFQKGGFGECALVPDFRPEKKCEGTLVPDFRSGGMYPRSGFRSRGTCAKTTLLENHPFGNPRLRCLSFPWTLVARIATLPASYKCEDSQEAQKCLWRVGAEISRQYTIIDAKCLTPFQHPFVCDLGSESTSGPKKRKTWPLHKRSSCWAEFLQSLK